MKITDYLQPNLKTIRHNIRGIDDSYNNSWDILAELIQNAVDAVRKACCMKENANIGWRIEVFIDCQKRTIRVEDNGVGISKKELPDLLKLYGTNKENDMETVGEKGVGLKFAIFKCNDFRLVSTRGKTTCEVRIKDAYNWKNRTDNTQLEPEFTTCESRSQPNGTMVEIKDVQNESLFNLKWKQFEYLLRSRTAIGNTRTIWENDTTIEVLFELIDSEGVRERKQIDFKYWLLAENLISTSVVKYDDFMRWATGAVDRTDKEKILYLQDKAVFRKGVFEHPTDQRIIKYYVLFIPTRAWSKQSIQLGLCSEENMGNSEWNEEYYFCKLEPGIFLSVRGMPTGISLTPPATGAAGYWQNLFILFEDVRLRFDIGRKSIHGRQGDIYKKYAKTIFNDFASNIIKYVTGDPPFDDLSWDKEMAFSRVLELVDLGISNIMFQKKPCDQEASVAAIFFECIGNGKITGFLPLALGYRNKYDLYALYGEKKKKVVVEFKSRLEKIIKDFNDMKKMFEEIDWLICWEIRDSDIQALKNEAITVVKYEPSQFNSKNEYPFATHTMMLATYSKPIHIMDLKEVLERT